MPSLKRAGNILKNGFFTSRYLQFKVRELQIQADNAGGALDRRWKERVGVDNIILQ
jgi:hypothetical protein